MKQCSHSWRSTSTAIADSDVLHIPNLPYPFSVATAWAKCFIANCAICKFGVVLALGTWVSGVGAELKDNHVHTRINVKHSYDDIMIRYAERCAQSHFQLLAWNYLCKLWAWLHYPFAISKASGHICVCAIRFYCTCPICIKISAPPQEKNKNKTVSTV